MDLLSSQVESAIQSVADSLETVSHESIEWNQAHGRFLHEEILADRDSPAVDVSAMDGYALRLADIHDGPIEVAGTVAAGHPPLPFPVGKTIRVFTGAPVPAGAECVIRREDTEENGDTISIRSTIRPPRLFENIRRRGENIGAGVCLLQEGTQLTSAGVSALASFGYPELDVFRKVRLVILNTGDEIRAINDPVEDWQIRDSNGPCLEYLLKSQPYLDVVARVRVKDDLPSLRKLLQQWIPEFDAIIVTGGVSMGDTDHVPSAIEGARGKILFHKIPIRPGKPMLGALGPNGQLILGLPGNPVSTLVTARRFALPLLRKLAGARDWLTHPTMVHVQNPDERTLDMVWFRLVRMVGAGCVELLDGRGSGDIASLAVSDGFIEIPPNASGLGPWPYYRW